MYHLYRDFTMDLLDDSQISYKFTTVVCETLADQTLAGFRIFLEIFKNTIIYLVKNVGIFFKVTGSFVFFLKTGKRYRPNSFCIVNYGSHSMANLCWTNPFSTSGGVNYPHRIKMPSAKTHAPSGQNVFPD